MCKWLRVQHLKSKSNLNQKEIRPSGAKQRGEITQTGKIRWIRTFKLINPDDSSPVLRAVMWGCFNCPTVVGTPLGTGSGDPKFPRKVGGVSEEATSNHKIVKLNVLYHVIKSSHCLNMFFHIHKAALLKSSCCSPVISQLTLLSQAGSVTTLLQTLLKHIHLPLAKLLNTESQQSWYWLYFHFHFQAVYQVSAGA